MYIAYTEEQEALRRELRAYYDEAADPRDPRSARTTGTASARPMRAVVQRMGADGWLGIGWPKEYGGQGRSQIEQFIFFDESMRARRPGADAHDQHRRPDDHAARQRRAEALLPAEDPRRARSTSASATPSPSAGHRPRVAHDARRARRRRVRHQRPEDLHEPRRRRRLHLARGAHRSRARRSTRASRCFAIDMKTPGIRVDPHAPALASTTSTPSSSTTCACRRRRLVGRREQGLEADHQPAQPRARDALLLGPARAGLRGDASHGRSETEAARRPARRSTRSGCRSNLARVYAGLEFLRLINWKVAWTGTPGAARRRRRVDHQGVRHRVLPRVVPPADGDPRPARVPAARLARRRRRRPARDAVPRPARSSPSAAAPTRSSAT